MDHEPLRYIPEPEHATLLVAPTRRERVAVFFSNLRPKLAGRRRLIIWGLTALLVVFVIFFRVFLSAPIDYPAQNVLAVQKGETLSGLTRILYEKDVVRSPFFFKAFLTVFGGPRGLVAGDYYLENPQSVVTLAWRLSHGSYELRNVRVTIPEGFSSKDIAAALVKTGMFVHFDPAQFQKLAAAHEGYLFPDTYMFLPSVTAEDVISAMTKTYEKRIQELAVQIQAFNRPIKDVIIMASIVEEEARTEESRRTIAGILWKRLDEGMPLQVDAAFAFVNGKGNSADLTLDDLKINSPYNTYVNKGLPPGPISNPGLASILATVTPIKTKYYFYLSDAKGIMHYGITHDDHLINKEKYLR